MLILLDQDGVLADFEVGFRGAWTARYAHHMPALPPHSRKSFRLRDDYPHHLADAVSSVYESPGFYLNLPPMPGALDGIREMIAEGHDVRICTSPLTPWHHCVSEKYEWVERYLGAEFTERMILTKDKTLVRGDVLVDDKPRIRGAETPIWKHVLYEAPYNRTVAGPRMTWETWRDAIKQ